MRICRKRYVITRNNDTEIFCGLARNYQFKPIENIGNTAIKTYLSRNKAIASFESSWADYIEPKYNCLEVSETVEEIAELKASQPVRCKDCVKRKTEDCSMYYECECGEQHTWEVDDDYCSVGERRVEE